jgi:hypothetical protein
VLRSIASTIAGVLCCDTSATKRMAFSSWVLSVTSLLVRL